MNSFDFFLYAFSRGDTIYLRFIDSQGQRRRSKIKYQPFLFLQSDDPAAEYRTIFGQPCIMKRFDSMREARQAVKATDEISGSTPIFGMTDFTHVFLNEVFPGEIKPDRRLINVGVIDIEVGSDQGFPSIKDALKPITAITLKVGDTIYSYGCGAFESTDTRVIYRQCYDEVQLLKNFIEGWEVLDLDIVTGWNIEMFDIPYLVNRIRNVLDESWVVRLSPWKRLVENKIKMHGEYVTTEIPAGVSILDYMALYKKFRMKPQESYSLNHICSDEIGEKKIDFSDYTNLITLYRDNFQLFMEYNIHDVLLVDRLDEKLGLINLAITLAFDAKINFDEVFGPVKMWDMLIHHYFLERKIVVPRFVPSDKEEEFLGAFVKEPVVGQHEWVTSFDLNSLYPSLIVQYNLSPETFAGQYGKSFTVEELAAGKAEKDENLQNLMMRDNLVMAANSTMWRKDRQGMFAELVEKFLRDRDVYKTRMKEAEKRYEKEKTFEIESEVTRNDNMQMCRKIQLNSLYGACGNPFFRWYRIEFAEAITKSGQLTIRTIENGVNGYLDRLVGENKDRVVAIDTDSNYIVLGDIIEKYTPPWMDRNETTEAVDQFCKQKLEPKIAQILSEFSEKNRAYKNVLKMKREVIAEKGIWTAKKKYVLNVMDKEGIRYDEPRLKITGLDAIKSTLPAICKQKLKDSIAIIMDGDQKRLHDLVRSFRSEFKKLPFEDIAKPTGVHDLSTYTDEAGNHRRGPRGNGCPIYVRAAITFNQMLRRCGVEEKYQPIRQDDKIKYSYMKMPNPTGQNVMAVLVGLPPEFGLDAYIDHDEQFRHSFLSPLQIITDAIGWTTEPRSTLDRLISGG